MYCKHILNVFLYLFSSFSIHCYMELSRPLNESKLHPLTVNAYSYQWILLSLTACATTMTLIAILQFHTNLHFYMSGIVQSLVFHWHCCKLCYQSSCRLCFTLKLISSKTNIGRLFQLCSCEPSIHNSSKHYNITSIYFFLKCRKCNLEDHNQCFERHLNKEFPHYVGKHYL